MDEETRVRLEVIERQLGRVEGRLQNLEDRARDLLRRAKRVANRINRILHFGKMAFDESDPRSPLRLPPDDE